MVEKKQQQETVPDKEEVKGKGGGEIHMFQDMDNNCSLERTKF